MASVGSVAFGFVQHPRCVVLAPVVGKIAQCLSLGLTIGGLDFLLGIADIILARIYLSFTLSLVRLLSTLALVVGLYCTILDG